MGSPQVRAPNLPSRGRKSDSHSGRATPLLRNERDRSSEPRPTLLRPRGSHDTGCLGITTASPPRARLARRVPALGGVEQALARHAPLRRRPFARLTLRYRHRETFEVGPAARTVVKRPGASRTNENARRAGVLLSTLSSDQPLRLRRANPMPARPSPSRLSVAGSGTAAVLTDSSNTFPLAATMRR